MTAAAVVGVCLLFAAFGVAMWGWARRADHRYCCSCSRPAAAGYRLGNGRRICVPCLTTAIPEGPQEAHR